MAGAFARTRLRAGRAFVLLIAVSSLLLLLAGAARAEVAKVGPPSSIDALGDSITRGYDSQGSGCGSFADCPANSWATGTNSGVNSYFTRVKALNPSVVLAQPVKTSTTGGNDAVTGAKMANLLSQAENAVKAPNKPGEVLILMGANDVCTSTEATMTSVSSFRSSLIAGMNKLSSGLPDGRIDVASIPNIYNLWKVLKSNLSAQLTWGLAGICQSMLASPTSTTPANETRRLNVKKRNEEFNVVLKEVCATYIHCHYDNGAAFSVEFAASEVSTLDYFHPNTNGQAKAAATEFAAGPSFTDLTAPNTTISRDRPAEGVEDWYRAPVTVTIKATDSNDAVAGSEYFYKLEGSENTSWIKYEGPINVAAEGKTTITSRSVDSNGNISETKTDVIKIDEVKPSFTLTCPAGPVMLNSQAAYTISAASDSRSGFAADPDGTFAIETGKAGSFDNPVQIVDRAGNTTTLHCTIEVVYPTPGVPGLSSGTSPNTGVFSLAWTPSADPLLYSSLEYTLQHRNAAGVWTDVSSSIFGPVYAYTAGSPEGEGTWQYRVKAHEGALATAYSEPSEPVKVDNTPPNTPTLAADRSPDYAGGGGWYKDSVTVATSANGDPNLADGSAGSGVDPTSIPAPVIHSTSGPFTDEATVKDLAGNTSGTGSLTTQVDATAPNLSVTCPESALLNGKADALVVASDGQSGLAADPSGAVTINTSIAGTVTVTESALDNVGHETTSSCSIEVLYPLPGVPALSAGTTPNIGVFALGWTPSADPLLYSSLEYTLQHRNAAGAWSDVSSSISGPAYAYTAGLPESEGTWEYRVMAHEGALATGFSEPSEPVKVDNTQPFTPTLAADRSPDYAGGGGWYKDSVTVATSANGDPNLADGSAGSGVAAASIPAPTVHSTSGSFTDEATVKDLAGNTSGTGSLTTQVDATAPSLSVTCPSTVLLNGKASASVTASDLQSGLAADPTATVTINTATVGSKTTTRIATDNVGHSTTKSCTTVVGYAFSGILQPVNPDGSSIFKLGSTVPVKFALKDAAGVLIGTAVANLTIAKVTNEIDGSYVEASSTSAATTGTLFRYDAAGQQYIFNLGTSGLSKGTWNLKVTLDDGNSYTQRISLK
jgi:GDSL-like Lipase/Acylhydrolase family